MKKLILIFLILLTGNEVSSQIDKAPERYRGEGPFNQLIIRGATLINGNGSPPTGPVDIVIEKNLIKRIVNVGYPGIEIKENKRPKLNKTGIEIDAEGKFVLPGFIEMHGHISSQNSGKAEYVYKLWMAHGITTIRDPSCGQGLDWVLDQKVKRNIKRNTLVVTICTIILMTSISEVLLVGRKNFIRGWGKLAEVGAS